jgi:hypothetical protein
MTVQLALTEWEYREVRPEKPTIDERWAEFERTNPRFYETVRRLALEKARRGAKRIGIGALFEVARWELDTGEGEDGYKANNDFRAVVSRLLMEREPELRGVFETRKRRCK